MGGFGIIGADGHNIQFVRNENAKVVSFDEVANFIFDDKTDQIAYEEDKFTCGDFAEKVQNNAERAGIKCGYVLIDFEDGNSHMCNVFDTTDRGEVYIDCTCFDSKVNSLTNGGKYTPGDIGQLSSGAYVEIMGEPESMGIIKDYTVVKHE